MPTYDDPPPPLRLEVRRAFLGDAAPIARVHVAAWKKGYVGLLPADYLGAIQLGARQARWEEILMQDGPSVTLVGLLDGMVTGFASVGPSRDDDAADGVGELWAIYLDPEAWRCGLGSVLHDAALDELRAGGSTEATLWVLEGNARAIGFYERHGWVVDGATKVDERDAVPRPEVRYRRAL